MFFLLLQIDDEEKFPTSLSMKDLFFLLLQIDEEEESSPLYQWKTCGAASRAAKSPLRLLL